MSPLPPITTIFMMSLLFYVGSWKVAVPGLGARVAVLRLHAACAGHVTKAAYSCLRGVYVLHGTNAPHHQGSAELRRIPLLGTWVNRSIKKVRSPTATPVATFGRRVCIVFSPPLGSRRMGAP